MQLWAYLLRVKSMYAFYNNILNMIKNAALNCFEVIIFLEKITMTV